MRGRVGNISVGSTAGIEEKRRPEHGSWDGMLCAIGAKERDGNGWTEWTAVFNIRMNSLLGTPSSPVEQLGGVGAEMKQRCGTTTSQAVPGDVRPSELAQKLNGTASVKEELVRLRPGGLQKAEPEIDER